MLLLMIESPAAFCRHCPLLSWLLNLHTPAHTHTHTFSHAHAHTLIFRSAQNFCFQSNFCRCSDPWNGAKSLSSPQRYVKAADCLIQPSILTLWPPLNTSASLPQYPRLSQKQGFSSASNSAVCMQAGVYVHTLKFERDFCCQVCVCVCAPFQGYACVCVCVCVRHLV